MTTPWPCRACRREQSLRNMCWCRAPPESKIAYCGKSRHLSTPRYVIVMGWNSLKCYKKCLSSTSYLWNLPNFGPWKQWFLKISHTHTHTHTYTHTHSQTQTHTHTHTHTDRVVPDIVVTFGPLWIPGASCLLLAGGALGTGGFLTTLPDVPANAQRQVGLFCATSQMPTLHLGQTLNHSTSSDIMFLRMSVILKNRVCSEHCTLFCTVPLTLTKSVLFSFLCIWISNLPWKRFSFEKPFLQSQCPEVCLCVCDNHNGIILNLCTWMTFSPKCETQPGPEFPCRTNIQGVD